MANAGEDSSGSQFFIVYADSQLSPALGATEIGFKKLQLSPLARADHSKLSDQKMKRERETGLSQTKVAAARSLYAR